MSKRFTDTDKWTKNKWFRNLKPKYKLFWIFILDNCDSVGVWEEDISLASYLIGVEIDLEKAIEIFNGKIHIFKEGRKWWIKDFIGYQYGMLDESKTTNRPHQSYISLLKSHGLWIDYEKTTGSLKEQEQEQDKDKEQDKDQDKEKEQEQEQAVSQGKKKKPKSIALDEEHINISLIYHQRQKEDGLNAKGFKEDLTEKSRVVTEGANAIRLLIEQDRESLEDIKRVLSFVLMDQDFWKSKVVTLAGLRNEGRNGNTKYFNAKNSMQESGDNKLRKTLRVIEETELPD